MIDNFTACVIGALMITTSIYHVVKYAKSAEWSWLYCHIALLISGSMIMGAIVIQ